MFRTYGFAGLCAMALCAFALPVALASSGSGGEFNAVCDSTEVTYFNPTLLFRGTATVQYTEDNASLNISINVARNKCTLNIPPSNLGIVIVDGTLGEFQNTTASDLEGFCLNLVPDLTHFPYLAGDQCPPPGSLALVVRNANNLVFNEARTLFLVEVTLRAGTVPTVP